MPICVSECAAASVASNDDNAFLDPSHGHTLERPDCDCDVDTEW